jgi:hypothetical protein
LCRRRPTNPCQVGRPLAQAVDVNASAKALAGRAAVQNKLKNYMEAAADASHAIDLDSQLAAAHKEKG